MINESTTVQQLTLNAATNHLVSDLTDIEMVFGGVDLLYRGDPLYMKLEYIWAALLKALIAARAAARLSGGRGMLLLIHARATT